MHRLNGSINPIVFPDIMDLDDIRGCTTSDSVYFLLDVRILYIARVLNAEQR
jgi:hypothetical protein